MRSLIRRDYKALNKRGKDGKEGRPMMTMRVRFTGKSQIINNSTKAPLCLEIGIKPRNAINVNNRRVYDEKYPVCKEARLRLVIRGE